ncbi:MAG: hypothetical protein RI907_1830 [Pseudomonadota bacterium]|jgi:predicted GNAT family acetyltransferase
MTDAALDIHHLPQRCRFEAVVEGLTCEVDYRLNAGVMVVTHTGVPRQLEGRGIAAAMVKHALNWARTEGLRVQPLCSYVAVYMRRHAEWQDLLA